MKNESKCNHPKESQTKVVTEAFDIYELTRIRCTKCNEFITKPKHE